VKMLIIFGITLIAGTICSFRILYQQKIVDSMLKAMKDCENTLKEGGEPLARYDIQDPDFAADHWLTYEKLAERNKQNGENRNNDTVYKAV